MPRRLSIFRPVLLLVLCFVFLGLYLDRALQWNLAPRKRFAVGSNYAVGIEYGLVAVKGPYQGMGIYRPDPRAKNVLFLRGIGYALRVDRVANDDGSFTRHWFVRVPHWFFAALFAGLSIFSLRRHLRLQQMWERAARGLCAQCGYDLRASAGRCPECGLEAPAGVSEGRG